MILVLIFIALLRLAWLMRTDIYNFMKRWSANVSGIPETIENQLILFEDINFNSIDPLYLTSGKEIIIYERRQDDRTLPGARRDFWYLQSMKFKGNVDYQIIVYNDKDTQIIPMSDADESEIPNIYDWFKTLPILIKEKLDNPERRAIALKVVSSATDTVGTGIATVPAILYKQVNYQTDFLSYEFKHQLEKNKPVEFCMINSAFEKLPTGVYIGIEGKETQSVEWHFKSLKVNKGSKIRLIIQEESIYTKFKDIEIDFVMDRNIPDLETWLELLDQDKVKYVTKRPNKNERRYLLELL